MKISIVNTQQHIDHDHHEQVLECVDTASGLHAFIAVHNTHLGPALGGCRMWPYSSREAAMTDVLRLSRGMTYKSAISRLPLGGGKAVIIGDPRSDKSTALLESMGRFVESLDGRYITAEDAGTSVADLTVMQRFSGHIAGVQRSSATIGGEDNGDPSPSTAYGVYIGICTSLKQVFGSASPAGRHVAIQGVGNVGRRLAKLLTDAGARVTVADIHESAIESTQAVAPVEVAPLDDIHQLPADVFAPCALGGFLTPEAIGETSAPVIAGAANNQLASELAGEVLMKSGKFYAPDYVLNAGGIIDIYHQRAGSDEVTLRRHIEAIGGTLTDIYQESLSTGLPTGVIADRIAERRFADGELAVA